MPRVYHATQLPLLITSKVCKQCHEDKPLDAFFKADHGKFGRHAICRKCLGVQTETVRGHAIFHGVILLFGSRYLIYLLTKSCTQCDEQKALDLFYYVRKNGWPKSRCKQCEMDNSVQWYLDHPDQVKQHNQKRQTDPEYIEYHREKERTRYNTNPAAAQKTRENVKAYRKANPLKKRQFESRREFLKKEAPYGSVSYERILERDGSICYICNGSIDLSLKEGPASLAFDHVIPLNPRKGEPQGAHTEDNIRPSHQICNNRKRNKPFHLLTPYDRRGIS